VSRTSDPGSRAGWRIVYRMDSDAIVILDVFEKKTPQTPRRVAQACRDRLKAYERKSAP